MKKTACKCSKCALILIICAALLLSGVLSLIIRPDWHFAVEHTLRSYPAPDVAPVRIGSGTTVKIFDFVKNENVWQCDSLFLVNASHPLPKDYEVPIEVYMGAEMRPEMIEAYIALRDAVVEKTGERIYVSDDYRTSEEQAAILAEKGDAIAAGIGCSEHEAGLALDVYVKGYGGTAFLKSAGGRAVNRICGEYGFIIRYGMGKEDITGIAYEPWHLRYVGVPHSRVMAESNLSLEEYFDLFLTEQWYRVGDYLVLFTSWDQFVLPDGWESATVSSDNRGHTVITLKMAEKL